MRVFLGFLTVISMCALAEAQDFFQAPEPPQLSRQLGELRGQIRALAGGPFTEATYLGVNLAEIDSNRAKELKLKEAYGVEITRVEENSPAEKAGIKPGDVVLEYNSQRVEGMEQFGRMVRETPPGREVKLTIGRDGKTQTLTAVVASRRSRAFEFPQEFTVPAIPPIDIPQIYTATRTARLGVEAEALGDQLANYFGVKQGALVRAVLDNSPAQKAGFRAGDVITKVDGTAVSSPAELSNAVRMANSKRSYAVEIMRDRKPLTLTVQVEDRSERPPRGRFVQNSVTN
jgi:serine protease Do